MTRVIALLLLAACAGTSPVELGAVSWDSGFDGAAAAAKKAGKPLLVLFQEVPG